MSENVLCTRCDTPNPSGASFCISCAASLDPVAGSAAATGATRRVAAPVAVSSPARRCPGCGSANPSEARFCVVCGSSFEARPPAYAPQAPALAAAGGVTVQHIYVTAPAELPLIVRALWFFFVGLPLSLAWVIVAWLLNLTLIGLPLGLWMLTMMPQVMTLRQDRPAARRSLPHSATSFAMRTVYFVLIGWWLSLLWMLIAWGMSATVIGLPLAFLMFERTAAVMTLSDA